MNKGLKICPFCGAEIPDIAIKCRNCKEDLDITPNHQNQNIIKSKSKGGCIWSIFFITLIFVVIVFFKPFGAIQVNENNENQYNQNSDNVIENKIYIGDVFKTATIEGKILSAEQKTFVGNQYFGSRASSGAIYIVVEYSYKNISDKPLSMWDQPKIHLLDAKGTEYDQDYRATLSYTSSSNHNEKAISDLNPGVAVNGGVVFEVNKEFFDPSTWMIKIEVDSDVEIHFTDSSIYPHNNETDTTEKQVRINDNLPSLTIIADKVYFYDKPNGNKLRAYLYKGDIINILEERNGFYYTEFTNTNGVTTKGWVNTKENSLTNNDKPASFTNQSYPIYPESARLNNIEGKTLVSVLISENGKPLKVNIVKREPEDCLEFDKVSIESVMNSEYSPAVKNGTPIETWLTVPLNFKLD